MIRSFGAAALALLCAGTAIAQEPSESQRRRTVGEAVAIGGYWLAKTSHGVSLLRRAGSGDSFSVWDYPRAEIGVVAGSTALLKVAGPGSDTLITADLSTPEAPSFRTILSHEAIGVIAAVEEGDRLHVAFSGVTDDHERVFYVRRTAGTWGQPQLLSPPGLTHPRIQPAIAVRNGRVVIAYAGFDGEDYEIYSVEGIDGVFTSEARFTDNRLVMDTLPDLAGPADTLTWIQGCGDAAHRTDRDLGGPPQRAPGQREVTSPNSFCGFGDSITEGNSENGYSQSTRIGYYPMLISLLESGYGKSTVFNRGYSGEGTIGGLDRLPSVLEDANPGQLLIMEGTNDVTRLGGSITESTIRDNLVAMVERCREYGTRPLLATLIPRGPDDVWDPENLRTMRVNALIRKAVIDNRVDDVEMFDAFYADPDYRTNLMADHAHPNSKGFDLMGKVWFDTISKLGPAAPTDLSAVQLPHKKKADVEWAGTPESDLSGYLLYYGTTPNVYDHRIDVGRRLSYRLSGLEFDKTYYLRARSYDSKQNLSALSSEASVTLVE